jgi:hypothetical protein
MRNPESEMRNSKSGHIGWGPRSFLECCEASLLLRAARSALGGRARAPLRTAARWRHRALPALLPLLCFIILHSAFCLRASGQSYTIDWSTIDGGGGTSTGGVYSVSGTIGQPDAGRMTGGNFTLDGGFWGLIAAVPTPGAPYLSIALNPQLSTITVSWPVSATSWQLQTTTNLVTGGGTWSACSYVTNGANCVYVESTPLGNKFYRLQEP